MACLFISRSTTSILVSLCLFLLVGCSSPEVSDTRVYDHIADAQAAQLLRKAMNAAGGLHTWESLSLISFEKHMVLFAENGEIEQDTKQRYIQTNNHEPSVVKVDDDGINQISYQLGADFIRIKGDVNPNIEEPALRSSMLSASFVISLPFKLLDKGSELSYAGTDTLEDGKEVEVLKVVYNPEVHANHSTPDTWWHYFDAETYEHLAYMVQHADHFSYVENITQTQEGGIVFPLTRRSWRVDENRSLLWLRAEYEYSDFQIAKEE